MTHTLVTATGLTAMLEEPDHSVQVHALQSLDRIVDEFWPEIADSISQIEALYEDKSFPGRELAALVASKVFFHLEEYSESTKLALAAGTKLNLSIQSDYTNVITTQIIDEYIKQQKDAKVDHQLSDFLERMFSSCLKSGNTKCGLGIAIECERLDWVKKYISASEGTKLIEILEYCQHHVKSSIALKSIRSKVLALMLEGYHSAHGKDRDWPGAAKCVYLLGKPDQAAGVLDELLNYNEDSEWGRLMALQLAFDFSDHEDQVFCRQVSSLLESSDSNVRTVLEGRTQVSLGLDFLFRKNQTDLLLVENLRSSIDQRSSVLHNGVVIAHSLMQAGTTNDAFLRKNLEWLAKSTHWAKFTATASLGVIHKGNMKDSKNLLSTYLPTAASQPGRSPYSEGGAFLALGLIHVNHYDSETAEYLRSCLSSSQGNEVLQVGACLGLGLTCLATKSDSVYETLRNVLFLDSAVAGEAAGFSIGLVMTGSGHPGVIRDLLSYAHETQHEKIVRSCAVALALVVFEKEQEADDLITQMTNDADAIIRYGGMFAIGMAYCGSSQNAAVKKLLHFSVSDVSDDVRRAAVISLGLVLSNEPTRIPKILKLLSQSYNPHVRYGTCIALGIGCPGMAASVPEAVGLLEPLLTDVSEFVRQGALISMGLVLQETSSKQVNGKAEEFRNKITKMVGEKHEDIMCRFGGLLANGLIDIGGRNASVRLFTKSGSLRMGAAVGFCLFAQMWYWYPMVLMISLAINPTALIGINKDLKMPKNFSVRSKTKPSMFAYPPEFKVETKESKSRLASAILTASKGRKSVEEPSKDEEMEVDIQEQKPSGAPEPDEEILKNPCRVVPAQEAFIEFIDKAESRFHAVIPSRSSGFVVLYDSKPHEPEEFHEVDLVQPVRTSKNESSSEAVAVSAEEEAPPPEAFEWDG
jgi:26S proteasome regulatory subunit N2